MGKWSRAWVSGAGRGSTIEQTLKVSAIFSCLISPCSQPLRHLMRLGTLLPHQPLLATPEAPHETWYFAYLISPCSQALRHLMRLAPLVRQPPKWRYVLCPPCNDTKKYLNLSMLNNVFYLFFDIKKINVAYSL